ncbi:MAG: CPXCG motif-containing cysteine-rich protein [Gemmataceae bacterium]
MRSLCETCARVREVVTPRGSRVLLCQVSTTDPAYPNIGLSAGTSQEHVKDCPVCCRPNVVHVEVDDGDDVRVWAQGE